MSIEEKVIDLDGGYTCRVKIEQDIDGEYPWERDCCAEKCTRWGLRARGENRSYERAIMPSTHYGSALLVNMQRLTQQLRTIGGCSRKQAHEQSLQMFDSWRDYINGEWTYVSYSATTMYNGKEIEFDTCDGYEYDYSDYSVMGKYMWGEIVGNAISAKKEHELESRKEAQEALYWAQRDTVTVAIAGAV